MPDFGSLATDHGPSDYRGLISDLLIERLERLGRDIREHPESQIKLLMTSIQAFGFIEPVVVDGECRIIVGYGRVLAAKRLGWTHVPALRIDHLTIEQKRAYMIASNRLAEKAGWNKENLALEFKDLAGRDLGFSLDATGFTIEEREALVFGSSNPEEGEDDAPQTAAETVTQLGDLWLCDNHRVLNGDALAPKSFQSLMQGDQAQAIFTDPPYNVPTQGHITSNPTHGDFVQGAGEMTEEEFAGFLNGCVARMADVLAPGGLLYACMDWRSISALIAAVGSAYLKLLNLVVWAKTQPAMGSMYRSQHELIVLASKAGAPHANNIQLGRYGRNRSNLWTYEGVGGFGAEKQRLRALHPTVKPVALIRDALLDCTRPGDIVCDPFSGSGSTLIACESTGRRARVMDLDPKYVDVTVRRWQERTGRRAVHATSGLAFDEVARHRESKRSRPPVRSRRRIAQEA